MDNLPSKKAKLTTPRAARIRYTLELAIEPGMEELTREVEIEIAASEEQSIYYYSDANGKCLTDGRTSGLIRAVRTKGNGE